MLKFVVARWCSPASIRSNDVDDPFFSVAQARQDLGGIGRTKLYELIARGDLELLKLDGRSMITGRSLRSFKQKLLEQLAA